MSVDNSMANRKKLPFSLVSVSGESAQFIFDGEKMEVKFTVEMLNYLLDAGLRTRISAAGAGKGKDSLDRQREMAAKLAKGEVGRIGFNVDGFLDEIAEASFADLKEMVERRKNAPKGVREKLADAMLERGNFLMSEAMEG